MTMLAGELIVDENADADAVRKDYVAIDVSDAGELPPGPPLTIKLDTQRVLQAGARNVSLYSTSSSSDIVDPLAS